MKRKQLYQIFNQAREKKNNNKQKKNVLHVDRLYISPRAQGVLFTFSRPKGLKVVSSVEISADFENPFLKKICVERFSEIELKVGYPHLEL